MQISFWRLKGPSCQMKNWLLLMGILTGNTTGNDNLEKHLVILDSKLHYWILVPNSILRTEQFNSYFLSGISYCLSGLVVEYWTVSLAKCSWSKTYSGSPSSPFLLCKQSRLPPRKLGYLLLTATKFHMARHLLFFFWSQSVVSKSISIFGHLVDF